MSQDIIAHQDMSAEQLALVASLLSRAPPVSISVHLGVPFEAPSARGVTFRKPGRKPSDTELAAVYDEAPKQGQHFIVVIRNDVVDDVSLVLTVAHELAHVRQEQAHPFSENRAQVATNACEQTNYLVLRNWAYRQICYRVSRYMNTMSGSDASR